MGLRLPTLCLEICGRGSPHSRRVDHYGLSFLRYCRPLRSWRVAILMPVQIHPHHLATHGGVVALPHSGAKRPIPGAADRGLIGTEDAHCCHPALLAGRATLGVKQAPPPVCCCRLDSMSRLREIHSQPHMQKEAHHGHPCSSWAAAATSCYLEQPVLFLQPPDGVQRSVGVAPLSSGHVLPCVLLRRRAPHQCVGARCDQTCRDAHLS